MAQSTFNGEGLFVANLRKLAANYPCQIRLEGCNSEPTCLCHWRQIGMSGLGLKNDDWFGAIGCHSCHTKVDTTLRHDTEAQLDFARGVFRTQKIWMDEGISP